MAEQARPAVQRAKKERPRTSAAGDRLESEGERCKDTARCEKARRRKDAKREKGVEEEMPSEKEVQRKRCQAEREKKCGGRDPRRKEKKRCVGGGAGRKVSAQRRPGISLETGGLEAEARSNWRRAARGAYRGAWPRRRCRRGSMEACEQGGGSGRKRQTWGCSGVRQRRAQLEDVDEGLMANRDDSVGRRRAKATIQGSRETKVG